MSFDWGKVRVKKTALTMKAAFDLIFLWGDYLTVTLVRLLIIKNTPAATMSAPITIRIIPAVLT